MHIVCESLTRIGKDGITRNLPKPVIKPEPSIIVTLQQSSILSDALFSLKKIKNEKLEALERFQKDLIEEDAHKALAEINRILFAVRGHTNLKVIS
jgi:hypothetical protein